MTNYEELHREIEDLKVKLGKEQRENYVLRVEISHLKADIEKYKKYHIVYFGI